MSGLYTTLTQENAEQAPEEDGQEDEAQRAGQQRARRLGSKQEVDDHMKHVKGGEGPITLTDINSSWQGVLLDSLLALVAGSVPMFGFPFVAHLWCKYVWGRRQLLVRKDLSYVDLLLAYLTGIILPLLILSVDNICDAASFGKLYHSVKVGKLSLKAALEAFQHSAITTVVQISSFLCDRILSTSSLRIIADVEFYKNKQYTTLSERAKRILHELEDKFDEEFRADRPPEGTWDREMERLTCLHNFLAVCSGTTMLFGLGALSYGVFLRAINDERPRPAQALSLVMTMLLTSFRWYQFVQSLLISTAKLNRNSRQLLIFTSFVEEQAFNLWTQANRNALRQVLMKLESKMSQTKKPDKLGKVQKLKEAYGIPASDVLVTPTRPADTQLQDLLQGMGEVAFDETVMLSLKKNEDITVWWELRQYIQTDFMDESCIMDYCSILTLILVLCFALAGFMDWVIHQDALKDSVLAPTDILASGKLIQGGGFVLAICETCILAVIFCIILQACIDINSLLERDAGMLLHTATDLRLEAARSSTGEAGLVQTPSSPMKDQGERLKASAAQRMDAANLLVLLDQQVQRCDNPQVLLGVVITAQLRNGIFLTLGATGATYVWGLMKPLLNEMDLTMVQQGFARFG